MSSATIGLGLAWLLAAFFAFGSVLNLRAPEFVRAGYARWGYPDWFHYVTAGIEFTAFVLLLLPASRPFGAALGAAVMAAAAGTMLIHREYGPAIGPSVVLILTATLGLITIFAG